MKSHGLTLTILMKIWAELRNIEKRVSVNYDWDGLHIYDWVLRNIYSLYICQFWNIMWKDRIEQ